MALAEKITPKQRLLMQNIDTGEQKECRVVYVEKELAGPTKVAVEFTARAEFLAHRVSARRLDCQQLEVSRPLAAAAKRRRCCPRRLRLPSLQAHRRRKQRNALRIPRVTPGKGRQGYIFPQHASVLLR